MEGRDEDLDEEECCHQDCEADVVCGIGALDWLVFVVWDWIWDTDLPEALDCAADGVLLAHCVSGVEKKFRV